MESARTGSDPNQYQEEFTMENPTRRLIMNKGYFRRILSSQVLHAFRVFWGASRPGTVAAVVVLAFSAAFAVSAQEEMPQPSETVQQHACLVGLWKVTFYSGGGVLFEGFDQRHSDGTEILNTNESPGAPHGTGGVCLGMYKKIGPRTYKSTHPVWIFDGSGNLAATVVIRQKITVDKSGNTYSGSFSLLRYDLDGNPIGRVDGTLTATRITPE